MTALGTAFDNVNLSKNLTFKAFNNLPGVTISNFDLPLDDPAGGIHVDTDADIPSPARESCADLSIPHSDLCCIRTWHRAWNGGILCFLRRPRNWLYVLHPLESVNSNLLTFLFTVLSGDNLFLAAESDTTLHLSGRLIPQSGDDLNTIGQLFTQFLAGENSTLNVEGDSVQPPGASGEVGWLTTAFKTLVRYDCLIHIY